MNDKYILILESLFFKPPPASTHIQLNEFLLSTASYYDTADTLIDGSSYNHMIMDY